MKYQKLEDLLPDDFNLKIYNDIRQCVNSKFDFNENAFSEYTFAWNALKYRVIQCNQESINFTSSIRKHGDSPQLIERYNQEKSLFNFFTSGLSALESLFYGIFALGSLNSPIEFPMNTEKECRNIKPEITADKFSKIYPIEDISITMNKYINDATFKEWKKIRNILAHRSAPGRTFFEGSERKPAEWKLGTEIDEHCTEQRFKWLMTAIEDILDALNSFVEKEFN